MFTRHPGASVGPDSSLREQICIRTDKRVHPRAKPPPSAIEEGVFQYSDLGFPRISATHRAIASIASIVYISRHRIDSHGTSGLGEGCFVGKAVVDSGTRMGVYISRMGRNRVPDSQTIVTPSSILFFLFCPLSSQSYPPRLAHADRARTRERQGDER
jgi:hypothetical protein